MWGGLVGVVVWLAANAIPVVWQWWENGVFESEIHREPATPARRHASARNGLVGRLSIPRLRVSAIVREGTGEDTLGLAVGHIPSTAFPGEPGNVGVAGHRDTLFRGLRGIRENDLIRFETLGGDYVYRVESTEVVKPRDVGVLKAGPYSELTLVTCYPFNFVGSAPDRFIVKAREVTGSVPEQTAAEELPRRAPPQTTPANKVDFTVGRNHSRQLAPGISIGVTETDTTSGRVDGWMWVMPDRRTIWLRNQSTQEPVVFYGDRDGKRRELRITSVARNAVSGYLLLPDE